MFPFYNVNQISRNFYLNFNFAKNIHVKEINVNYVFFLLLLSCKKNSHTEQRNDFPIMKFTIVISNCPGQ